jgi:hypothetical protein
MVRSLRALISPFLPINTLVSAHSQNCSNKEPQQPNARVGQSEPESPTMVVKYVTNNPNAFTYLPSCMPPSAFPSLNPKP